MIDEFNEQSKSKTEDRELIRSGKIRLKNSQRENKENAPIGRYPFFRVTLAFRMLRCCRQNKCIEI